MIRKISYVFALTVLCCSAKAWAQDERYEDSIQAEAAQAKEVLSGNRTVFAADAALADSSCGLNQDRVDSLRHAVETASWYAWWTVIEAGQPSAGAGCAQYRVFVRVLPDDLPEIKRAVGTLRFLSGNSDSSDDKYTPLLLQAIAQNKLRMVGDHGRFHVVETSRLPVTVEQLKGKDWQCSEPRTASDMDGSHEYIARSNFRLEEGGRVAPSARDNAWMRFYELSGNRIYFYSVRAQGSFHDYNLEWVEVEHVSPENLEGPYGFKCISSAAN